MSCAVQDLSNTCRNPICKSCNMVNDAAQTFSTQHCKALINVTYAKHVRKTAGTIMEKRRKEPFVYIALKQNPINSESKPLCSLPCMKVYVHFK